MTIPACEPVSEIASWPRSLITIAARAHETRSPGGQQHVHLARVRAVGDLVGHRHELVRVLAARGEDGDHPAALLGALDDPPRRVLDALGIGHRGAAELHDNGFGAGADMARQR